MMRLANMDRGLFVFLIVACMAVWVNAIACPPNFCDTVRCRTDIRDNCCGSNKLYKPHGGFCGCCPSCVTIIPAGGACLILRGSPPTAECVTGTYCVNGTCQAL